MKQNIEQKIRDWENLKFEIQYVSGIYNPVEFQKGVERVGRLSQEYQDKYREEFSITVRPSTYWDIELEDRRVD